MTLRQTTAEEALPTQHWIAGAASAPESGEYFDVHNPVDDTIYARAARGDESDVDRAVAAAHGAFATYGKLPVKTREALLCKAAQLLELRCDQFVEILIDEIGSPISKARFEVGLSVDMLRAAAGVTRQITGKTLPSDVPGRFSMSIRQPLGVVASITPFNVPLIKGIRLSANPLACGNTVVLLPSEEAPVLANKIANLYTDAGFPTGAFNVVSGLGHEIGDSLTTHPLVKVVTFTGSCRVGHHIQKLCAEHNKRVTLELGGKNPLVILKDANLDKAVDGALHSIFTFQGQVCMAASRIYVEQPLYDKFLERFSAAAGFLCQGDLRNPDTVLGPIISRRQRDRVKSHIEDATRKGATLVTGGKWRNNVCQPTILSNVTSEMTIFAEETFGPVTSVYPVASAEEALEKANDSIFGLSASIYTSNLYNALRFANEVRSGMVHINAPSIHDEPHVPFGGVGDSGFGREGTEADIDVMTEWKWITIQQ